ncbi:BlaI/MecI/CopY family transcriptional regulator [Streptomyces sp. NPDC048275]|uniref:BlaI/MecI/CopY family transcriptional regulator n=1 Tax=Streptomyces sp. NPDC048275 TaxID=3155629 RepID=UPI0033DF1B80
MSEIKAPSTELTSQYIAQVTGDLERNAKEQERVGQEIEALQEQLRALQQDHTVLVNMQQALGAASPAAEAATAAAPSVPRQASAEIKQSKPKKAAATAAKKTAAKKPAAKASSVKASETAAKPTLVEVIRGHLEQQSEPRSAAEITAALTQAHPDRSVKTTVVRTTLEGLVAKGHVHRTKQGSSVFYAAAATSEPAPVEPQQEAVAG